MQVLARVRPRADDVMLRNQLCCARCCPTSATVRMLRLLLIGAGIASGQQLAAASGAAGGHGSTATADGGAGTAAIAWCGVFSYKGFATNAPLNITIMGSTASIDSVWDRKAHGCHQCCAEREDGLQVTRSGTRITFLGNNTVQDFCELLRQWRMLSSYLRRC